MAQYHVSFYKDVLSPYGIPFRCLQAEIQVDDAPTSDEAAVTAEREFERRRQISDWRICADDFEVEPEPRVLQPQCQFCGTSMLLIRREPHPAPGEESELRIFQCPACYTLVQVGPSDE
jgi:hypothetical protein